MKPKEDLKATIQIILKNSSANFAETVVAVGQVSNVPQRMSMDSNETAKFPVYDSTILSLLQGDQIYVRLFGNLTAASSDDAETPLSGPTFTGFLVQAGKRVSCAGKKKKEVF